MLICGCKSAEEVKFLKQKAAQAEQELQISLQNNKDVSAQIAKMKQVKVLADAGNIQKANDLLDEVLLDFKKINKISVDKDQLFINPRRVTIKNNPYNAMEPFITRDGEILFFNTDKTDTPNSNKNVYYATRIDEVTFQFMGEVKGINSNEVDGVPTMDKYGNFYFVSTANYSKKNNFATVYKGKFKNGEVQNITAIQELSLNKPGWVNMDVEISADGQTIYATQTLFKGKSWPNESYFFTAHLNDGTFKVDSNSQEIFSTINTDDLEYAASISTDELELFFTRANVQSVPVFTTYYATRPNKSGSFGKPDKIDAITGYAEAPAITNDGRLLYYHKQDNGRFYIYVLERK